jgi:hypothetical protein
MVDIFYMRLVDGKFFNVKDIDEVWDNSYFMEGFKNISDFVSNEINLLDVESGQWPINPFVMILDGNDISIILDYLKNEKRLISDLQNNNCRVIVNIREGGVNEKGYTYYEFEEPGSLDNLIQKNKIPKGNVIWMTPEYLIDNEQQKDFPFVQKFFNKWELQLDSIKQEYYHPYMLDIFKNGRNFSRPKHFYCVSSTPRGHRLDLIEFLRDNDLLKCGNATFFSNAHGEIENNEFEILGGRDLKFDSEYYWEGRDKTGDESYLPGYAINITQCFNSYFQLLTGSVYETDENCKFPFVFYNEKLWKSMITLQPFIFLGQPNTISMLKRFGFKTFHPLINEDYDKELNNEKRKVLIYDEIKRLCSMSIEDMDKWFWDMEDILIHNYNRLTEYGYEHYDEFIAILKEKI